MYVSVLCQRGQRSGVNGLIIVGNLSETHENGVNLHFLAVVLSTQV